MVLTEKDVERFWKKIRVYDDTHAVYIGSHEKGGYGSFYAHGKVYKAHRVAWELLHGPIPDGMDVLHTPPCVIRACIIHTYLGTDLDNIHDAMRAGRRPSQAGSDNPNAKLTKELVEEIRSYEHKLITRDIAFLFDITTGHVRKIIRREKWT